MAGVHGGGCSGAISFLVPGWSSGAGPGWCSLGSHLALQDLMGNIFGLLYSLSETAVKHKLGLECLQNRILVTHYNVIFTLFWAWKLRICSPIFQGRIWIILASQWILSAAGQVNRISALTTGFLLPWTWSFGEIDCCSCVLYYRSVLVLLMQSLCWAQGWRTCRS